MNRWVVVVGVGILQGCGGGESAAERELFSPADAAPTLGQDAAVDAWSGILHLDDSGALDGAELAPTDAAGDTGSDAGSDSGTQWSVPDASSGTDSGNLSLDAGVDAGADSGGGIPDTGALVEGGMPCVPVTYDEACPSSVCTQPPQDVSEPDGCGGIVKCFRPPTCEAEGAACGYLLPACLTNDSDVDGTPETFCGDCPIGNMCQYGACVANGCGDACTNDQCYNGSCFP
jgi:hypothetical protein